MKDIRDMRRSDWHRILERRYTVSPCVFRGREGVVSLLEIQKVSSEKEIFLLSRDDKGKTHIIKKENKN